jgi:hypothetical protein
MSLSGFAVDLCHQCSSVVRFAFWLLALQIAQLLDYPIAKLPDLRSPASICGKGSDFGDVAR